MNILILYEGLLDLATRHLTEDLVKSGRFKVHVALPSLTDTSLLPPGALPIEVPPYRSKVSWRSIRALRKALKSFEIDLIYAPTTSGLSNALIASWGTPTKCVGYRGTQARIRRTDPTYYLAILNPRVAHVVCETEDIKRYLEQFLPTQKLSVATKPFDTEWVAKAKEKPCEVKGIPSEALRLIFIGETLNRPYKGLGRLLEAMKLLEPLPIHLTVIGRTEEEERKWCVAHDLDKVHFLGPKSDAIHYLPSHDVLVLPSTRDASPRVVREAMACGLPCIVTDIPGARDLIEDQTSGLLCEPSPEAIAQSVRFLLEHPDRREEMSHEALRRIQTHFHPKGYTDKFVALLESLLK